MGHAYAAKTGAHIVPRYVTTPTRHDYVHIMPQRHGSIELRQPASPRLGSLCPSHRTIELILSTESARSLGRATATITRLSINITDTVRVLPFSSHTCDDWTLRAQVTYYCVLVALSLCFNSEQSEVYTRDGRVCMASLLISKTSCSR